MTTAFAYRPKFVDIRVKKPPPDDAPRAASERPCDHVGCQRGGAHRAPKARDREGEFWWFCGEHAAEYNRQWNYFSGMSAADLEAFDRAEANGHRPTWTFRAGRNDRLSAARRGYKPNPSSDPFGMFGRAGRAQADKGGPEAPQRSTLQVLALDTLGLDPQAASAAIRQRYADLVKKLHPDSNGGDRSYEGQLMKVIRAYQTLKSAGVV
jgi:curved DNA-binding protein CbpA